MRQRLHLYLLAVAIAALWGASFPVTKAALGWLGPFSIALLRWVISAVALFGWLAWRGRLGEASAALRHDGRTITWVAAAGVTLFYALENLSLRYTTAVNAGILANLTGIFIVLLAAAWLKERLRPIEWAATLAAFLGAALISQGPGRASLSASSVWGDLMMVAGTLFGAAFSVGGKRLLTPGLGPRTYPADVLTALVSAIGAAFLLPLALWEGLSLRLPLEAWAAILVLGLGSGALANLVWLYLLARMPAARAGILLLLVPVFSTGLSVIVLHEPLSPVVVGGGVLVVAGVALTQRQGEQPAQQPGAPSGAQGSQAAGQ
jgi:drug/metabolite transporter (DMT)-like permease